MSNKLPRINELYPEPEQPNEKRSAFSIPKLDPSSSNQEKQAALREALQQLSGLSLESYLNEEEEGAVINFFFSLYSDQNGYRHMYSDVCGVMYEYLKQDDAQLDDGVPYEAIMLANNMEMIQRKISKTHPNEHATECVLKLYDHIELENTRLRYMAKQNSVQIENVKKINAGIEDFQGKLQNTQEKLQNTQEKLQRNYVTILGIFAAVVLAFAGGATFTSSVLQGMAQVSIYRLIGVTELLAFILFNTIFTLFLFICRVSQFEEGKYLPRLIIATDTLLLVAILLTFLAWFNRWLTPIA